MSYRRRDLLHQNKLAEFEAHCALRGWQKVAPKGDYEVLRMVNPAVRDPLIVHKKLGAKEHVTTWGESARLAREFIQFRREVKFVVTYTDRDGVRRIGGGASDQTGVNAIVSGLKAQEMGYRDIVVEPADNGRAEPTP